MKQMKPMKPLKPMKPSPKRSSNVGNGFFWVIVAIVVLYFLLMASGWAGGSALPNILGG